VNIELLQNHYSLFTSGFKILKYKFLILFSISIIEKYFRYYGFVLNLDFRGLFVTAINSRDAETGGLRGQRGYLALGFTTGLYILQPL